MNSASGFFKILDVMAKFIDPSSIRASQPANFVHNDRSTLEHSGRAEENSSNFVYNPNNRLPIYAQRSKLPICASRDHLMFLLEKYQVVVVVGETGSGKSSQVKIYNGNCRSLIDLTI